MQEPSFVFVFVQLELRLTNHGVSDFTLSWRTEYIQRQAETHRNPVPGN